MSTVIVCFHDNTALDRILMQHSDLHVSELILHALK